MRAEQIATPATQKYAHREWQSLLLLCSVMFIVVSNGSGIIVSLPTIRYQLNLTDASFVWVNNAYLVTYAGTLLLSGRLGDFYGHRKIFDWGVATFTLASLGCAISNSAWLLVAARALQGVGGAAISTAIFSLITKLFITANERAKAIGIYTFCASMGGITGLALTGIFISLSSWRWLFVPNIAVGLLAYARRPLLNTLTEESPSGDRLDGFGAVTATMFVVLTVQTILNITQAGWLSRSALHALLCTVIALVLFTLVESRTPKPLIPLSVLRNRKLMLCCIVNMLHQAALPGCILFTIYFQKVAGHSALWGGLAFIPYPATSAIISLKLSARMIRSFGMGFPLILGLCACAGAFLLFARAPVECRFVTDALPGLILAGVAAGLTYSPLSLTAINCLSQNEAGLASGIFTMSSTLGNALGFAILVSIASNYTESISGVGMSDASAINAGYHVAFLASAIMAGFAILLVSLFGFLRSDRGGLSNA